ncbi:hypothetical protein [Streptomyces flavalbus]|uniref:Integrase n=1 Tax=Streptomyces flavalbus TaxID=2665155 RepID=A0ABW2WFL5_9ACTN
MSLARLKEALNRAVTRGLVTVDVASEVHIPLKARKAERKTKEVVQPRNASEVGAFVAAMKSDRLFAPLLLSLMGLRMAGERALPLPSLVREALRTFRATQAVDAWRRVRGTRAAGMCSWMNLGAR